ncbi:MAG: hypothetical protein ACD_49C00049G0022 [uncultured bacterium (gcode 4)]|uniref:Uncharacterized protein n=1 Tax=uncultured bacterium (gcode 4) TaxID=1234023 RepID=K2BVU7_9BACT|nr:MAG: hypothetical protein ACD_49C00049G0022 [uncultured bacterium (gcode 4)]
MDINNSDSDVLEQAFQFIMNHKEQKLEQVWLFNGLGVSSLWFSHKTTSKRNNKDSYKKIECFWYFKNEDKEDMINYLNSPEFKYANRSDWNYSIFYDMATKTVWKLTTSDLKDYEGVGFWYRQEFCKVLIHRREFYLIRVYFLEKKWNEDFSNWYFKLEITYREVENKKLRKKVSSKFNKPNAIIEIIKKIEKFWKGFLPVLNKDDYSNWIPFETFYKSISKKS